MLTLYKSMVRSRLEYCCPVWKPVNISDIQKLENVQRCFVGKIAGLKDMGKSMNLKISWGMLGVPRGILRILWSMLGVHRGI